ITGYSNSKGSAMQLLGQGKNWFLLASQPQGGAPLTLGYYMQPLGAKIRTTGTHLPEDPF
ncbi:MAG: hypothetical protein ACLP2X_13010, partial [Syntrophobacteraceae bacterium]